MLEAEKIGRKVQDKWLLDAVSLRIDPGDRIVLVGPSGSGKTLLLRALALLDPLDTGEVRWQGETVAALSVPEFRSRVMYLAQRPATIDGTVEHNLRQPYSLTVHRGKSFDEDQANRLLTVVGRDASFLRKHTHDLSGGELQLTALLRALLLGPNILLLDEPTAALDIGATENVESLVADWIAEQPLARSCVWVTHDAGQARRVADVRRQIDHGRLNRGNLDDQLR